jgi:hypothetical protein
MAGVHTYSDNVQLQRLGESHEGILQSYIVETKRCDKKKELNAPGWDTRSSFSTGGDTVAWIKHLETDCSL